MLRLINEALWVRAPEIVVGDLWDGAPLADLSVTRRFNLAAASARVLALLTTPDLAATSAAFTRWQVASAPSLAAKRRLGAPALALDLVRNRHGPTGRWILEWSSHDRAFLRQTSFRARRRQRGGRPRRHCRPSAAGCICGRRALSINRVRRQTPVAARKDVRPPLWRLSPNGITPCGLTP